ncbi:MAG: hypothetical protein IH602_04890 [Bryobacteraceae bacterium]|nr:hypothetical protein [Bryobacteraceae bacterium]
MDKRRSCSPSLVARLMLASVWLTAAAAQPGDYDVHIYRPWRGVYMPAIEAVSKGGELTVKIPELKPVASRVQNLGNDVAFKIVKRGVPLPK